MAIAGRWWGLLIALAAARPAAGQELGQLPRLGDHSQSFEVHADSGRFTVGDTVGLRFRVRLDERDLLFDTVPRPLASTPGVRVVRVEKLQRGEGRIFTGRATVAFYRPGRQPAPVFGLPFMRSVKGFQRGALVSDTAWVEIAALLPAGGPALKDIRGIEPAPGSGPWPFVAALVGLGALVMWLRTRRRRQRRPEAEPVAAPVPVAPAEPAPTAYQLALARLAEVEARRWPARGEIERHYEGVADVLRDYLEAAEEIPARERTTSELAWALPPHLADDGLRDRCRDFLGEADLVKFARARPGIGSAAEFVAAARDLLQRWHAAGETAAGETKPTAEAADAFW